jgi:hypothetical protein
MSLTEILMAIGVLSFIIYATFNIFYLIEIRKMSFALRQLIAGAEEHLYPTLSAARHISEDIQIITDDAAVLTKTLRDATETLSNAKNALKDTCRSYEENLSQTMHANVSGLKAGFKTGVVTLLSNLKDRKEGLS